MNILLTIEKIFKYAMIEKQYVNDLFTFQSDVNIKMNKKFMEKNGAAKRLKFIRILTGLSIQEFCESHDLKKGTLLKQESSHLAISKKAAENFVKFARKEGVVCSVDWLLDGKGDFPTLLETNAWKKLSSD